jgi:ribonuclease I
MAHRRLSIEAMTNPCRHFRLLLIAIATLASVCAVTVKSASTPTHEKPLNEVYTLELLWWPEYCHENPRLRYCAGASFQGFVLGAYIPRAKGRQEEPCKGPVAKFMPDAKLLKVMPDEELLRTQWDLYGACSGLSQTDYFNYIWRVSRSIKIPERFVLPDEHFSITIQELKNDFLVKNHRLVSDSVDVFCKSGMLSKIRIHRPSPVTHSAGSCELPTVQVISRLPLAE